MSAAATTITIDDPRPTDLRAGDHAVVTTAAPARVRTTVRVVESSHDDGALLTDLVSALTHSGWTIERIIRPVTAG